MKFSLSVNRVIFAVAGAIYLSLTWQHNGRSLPSQNSPNFEIARPNFLTNNGYEYIAKDGSYSINFPGKPEEQNLQIPNPAGQLSSVVSMYQDMGGQRAFFSSNVTYPVDPALYDVEKGLSGAGDMVVRALNTAIIEDKRISLQGMPGRELVLESPEGYEMRVQLFIDPQGPTLYQIWVGGTKGGLNTPEVQAFFDSFRVLK